MHKLYNDTKRKNIARPLYLGTKFNNKNTNKRINNKVFLIKLSR